MRAFVVLAVLAVAATLTLDAGASRKPTPAEKAALTVAVVTQVPDLPSHPAKIVVRRVVVSTVKPGPRANFTRFAAASVVADDFSLFPPGPRTAVIGLHRNGYWIMVGYGPNRVVCKEPQFFFGGRRAAILRDLGIRCPS
jgi:hypothetical protein